MTNAPTPDFFDRLEAELREAATRRPRRRRPALAPLAAGLAVAALAFGAIVLFGGDEPSGDRAIPAQDGASGISPVGTVIPKGSGRPAATTVVAAGGDPATGPWQLEVSRPRRDRLCLMLYLPSAPGWRHPQLGGYCGPGQLGFRKTPGFSRQQKDIPPTRHARTVVIFGRVPKRADQVVAHFPKRVGFTVAPQPAPPGFKRRFGFDASFYAIIVKRITVPGARINWLDASGYSGSRGIRLMPPLTPMKR